MCGGSLRSLIPAKIKREILLFDGPSIEPLVIFDGAFWIRAGAVRLAQLAGFGAIEFRIVKGVPLLLSLLGVIDGGCHRYAVLKTEHQLTADRELHYATDAIKLSGIAINVGDFELPQANELGEHGLIIP